MLAFNNLYFHIEDETVLTEIGAVIAIFHNLLLLIDDVEDASTVRRGHACAHLEYGVPLTINSGNLMYFMALRRAVTSLPQLWLQLHHQDSVRMQNDAYTILVDEMLNLHVGQGLDIYWRDNVAKLWPDSLPDISEYLQMVKNKTGGLFRLLVRLLALFSDKTFDLAHLLKVANLLGIIYQVRDDYLNLVDSRYSVMKGMAGEDLVEGKLSLPVLHSMRHHGGSTPVHAIVVEMKTSEERSRHPELVQKAIAYMRDTGSLEYTYGLLQEYVQKAVSELRTSGGDTHELEGIVVRLGEVARPGEARVKKGEEGRGGGEM